MRYFIAASALLIAPLALGADDPPKAAAAQDSAPLLAPLLPEGSFIREARGQVHRIGPGHPWIFSIDEDGDDATPAQDFILLPSHLLEEIELESTDRSQEQIDFVLSGEVLLYKNHNYLILQHVEMETQHAQRPGTQMPTPEMPDEAEPEASESDAPPDDVSNDPWSDVDDDFADMDQGDSVAAIVAQLQQDVGPLKQSVDRSADITDSPIGADEGDLLISRRGRLTRGRHGAWIIVFDADARGLMEPPAILLPSTQLRNLEYWARRGNLNRPMLLSGQIYSYRGKHFLLPTAWREPVERPNIK